MGRIIGNTSESTSEYQPRVSSADYAANDFRETSGRLRDGRERMAMHESRDAEVDARTTTRSTTADYTYRRGTSLDAPPPRPGYVQRWIRCEFRTETDGQNWQAKMREGYSPRDPSTVPDAEIFFGSHKHGDKAVIRVGGLILCEAPEQLIRAKRNAIREVTRRQEESVNLETDKASREGVRMGAPPIVTEDEMRVSTGRRPATLAD
jgi:hypothetical protein